MPKMWFSSENCRGATSSVTGRSYDADKNGMIHVDDARDVKLFKDGGYQIAGAPPPVNKYWTCDTCNRDWFFNHCSKCDSTDLRRVEN